MNDARREGPDAESALVELGQAFRRAVVALKQVDEGAGGAHALGALFALDDALGEGRPLGELLPELLAAATPGDRVARDAEDLVRRFAEVTERVAGERTALEELRADEEALRNRLDEHTVLRRQVDELRGLERQVLALDALQEQQEVITDRLAALRGRDTGVDEALRTSGEALVRLSEDQLAALAPRTRQILESAAAAQSELAAAEDEYREGESRLVASQDRLARIHEAHGARLASLRRYAAADRDLARALGKPQGAPIGTATPQQQLSLADVEAATVDMERRLRAADEVLRQVVAERGAQDADGVSPVPWSR